MRARRSVAVEQYDHALESGLPAEVDALIGRQAEQIGAAHMRIRALRDATKTSASEQPSPLIGARLGLR
jgi:hypothetical protein